MSQDGKILAARTLSPTKLIYPGAIFGKFKRVSSSGLRESEEMTRDIKPRSGKLRDAPKSFEDICELARSVDPGRGVDRLSLGWSFSPVLLDWLLLTCDTP
jgi:hypothetical protein